MRRLLAVLLPLLATLPVFAHTWPSLQNGSFATELWPWAIDFPATGQLSWRPIDANGGTSGSAELRIEQSTAGTSTRAFECVQIDPATTYDAGAKANIPRDQNADAITARVTLTWYANDTCTGASLGSTFESRQSANGAWQTIELRNQKPPAGATHVLFELTLRRTYNQGAQSRVLFDDAYLAGADHRLFIPAIASLPGAHNSDWTSDLHLVNIAPADITATLFYRCLAGTVCNTQPREVVVPHGGSVTIKDAAATLFQSPNSGGTVEIVSSDDLVVTSRLNSRAVQGTFGTDIPAVTGGAISTVFPGVRNGPGFRTNIGLYNPHGGFSQAFITVFADGKEIGSVFIQEVPPNQLLQTNLFALVNAAGFVTDNAFARVGTRGGPVIAYVSVIHNATNDATFSTGFAQP